MIDMLEIVWDEPPPPIEKGPRISWELFLGRLIENPNRWGNVGLNSDTKASVVALRLREKGAEATSRQGRVYARWNV